MKYTLIFITLSAIIVISLVPGSVEGGKVEVLCFENEFGQAFCGVHDYDCQCSYPLSIIPSVKPMNFTKEISSNENLTKIFSANITLNYDQLGLTQNKTSTS